MSPADTRELTRLQRTRRITLIRIQRARANPGRERVDRFFASRQVADLLATLDRIIGVYEHDRT